MDWQTVNESILDEALAPNEVQKVRMKRQDMVQQGAPDPVAEIVTAVPAEIRSRIAAGRAPATASCNEPRPCHP